jgi:hypothetical protein
MAEICRWLLYNKITSEHSSAFFGIFKNFIHVHKAEEKEEMLQGMYG